MQGVVRGRDITRLGLRAKEAKVVELQARVAALEAEREVDWGIIRRLRGKSGRGGGDVGVEEREGGDGGAGQSVADEETEDEL